jgi:hypothetical protein
LHPPLHELFASYIGYEPPKTIEEQWREGAMAPDDFLRWANATGGQKLGPSG